MGQLLVVMVWLCCGTVKDVELTADLGRAIPAAPDFWALFDRLGLHHFDNQGERRTR